MSANPSARLPILFLASFLVIGCANGQEAADPDTDPGATRPVLDPGDDAETILDKVIRANGGKKAVDRWNCAYLKYKWKGGLLPVEARELILEDWFELPGRMRRLVQGDIDGRRESTLIVMNGDTVWIKENDGPVRTVEGGGPQDWEHPFAASSRLTRLQEKGADLKKIGRKKVGGREALGLRVRFEGHSVTESYFDMQSGLLRKTKTTYQNAPVGFPEAVEISLSEYKKVQGLMVPTRVTSIDRDGQVVLEASILELEFSDELKDELFEKPK